MGSQLYFEHSTECDFSSFSWFWSLLSASIAEEEEEEDLGVDLGENLVDHLTCAMMGRKLAANVNQSPVDQTTHRPVLVTMVARRRLRLPVTMETSQSVKKDRVKMALQLF